MQSRVPMCVNASNDAFAHKMRDRDASVIGNSSDSVQ